MGPRAVLIRYAVGRIKLSSRTPTSPRVRSLSWTWIVRISERANSSSLVTNVAPHWAARSAVRFWLHAMTDISKATPTLATLAPSRPRPRTPNTLFSRLMPTVVPQCPRRVAASSRGMWRTRAKISLHVDRRVAHTRRHEQTQVRQTLHEVATERCALPHAGHDIEIPQSIRQGVTIGQMIPEDLNATIRSQRAPVGHLQRHALVVVENRNPSHRTPPLLCLLSPAEAEKQISRNQLGNFRDRLVEHPVDEEG